MRKALTFWNLLGLLVFLLGALLYWQSRGGSNAQALSLPSEEAKPLPLTLTLFRPNPPQGFLKETRTLELGPGEEPERVVLKTWSEALAAPLPTALYRLEKQLVVDLPPDFVQGLDATEEVFRLYSLAYTLLATFPPAEEVRFLVEGEPKPGLAHLDLSQPIHLP